MINESIWDKVDLIEKRFENRLNKSDIKFNTLNPVWDNEKEDALNVFEMIDELNYLNDCCNNLIDDNTEYVAEINQMHKENEQLKKDCTVLIYHNQEYRKENEQLKAQLYCDSEEGVCSICKHHYLEKGNIFYISKCEKGHEKCSKESVRHCEDFKLKELQE